MAEDLSEAGEESGETVGTGLRAGARRGGGTRLGAPSRLVRGRKLSGQGLGEAGADAERGRFGGAAGRAGPVLGEPTEAWRVGFSERVVPEPARIAARGLVPAAKAQEQGRPGQARGEAWQEARGAVARRDAERARRGVEGRSVAGSRGFPMRGTAGASGLSGLRGRSSGGVALQGYRAWVGRPVRRGGRRAWFPGQALREWLAGGTGQDTEERLEPRSTGNTRGRLLPERSLRKLGGALGRFWRAPGHARARTTRLRVRVPNHAGRSSGRTAACARRTRAGRQTPRG